MSRRGARLMIAVLFALACGAAAWQYARVDRALTARELAASAFERDARTLETSIIALRGTQQAYVAAGQGLEYWTSRVTTDIGSLRSRLEALRREAADAQTISRIDTASGALDGFARLDARARQYATANERLLASDLIFGEGFEKTRAIVDEISAARETEASVGSAAIQRFRRQQLLLAGGTTTLGLLFLLILAFAPGPPARAAAIEPPPTRTLDLQIAAQPETAGTPPHPAARRAPSPAIDLMAAGDLCLDFARVRDTEEIPALLERAERVLDAKGLVLWIADPDGRELVPTVAHGYPASSLARLGTIHRDSDNATAAAFREGRVHVVKGDQVSSGAIVAPLVSPGGCVGVMAAEIRNGHEVHDEVRAVALILAAQLATLIGVSPVPQPQAKAN